MTDYAPLPPSHWKWAGDQAVLDRESMQNACLSGAERYGLDPDDYTWEELRDELMELSAAAVKAWDAKQAEIRKEQQRQAAEVKSNGATAPIEFTDWASFCLRFETVTEALEHVAEIPDGDELFVLADKCECTADKELDWPEYRDAVVLEIKECWA